MHINGVFYICVVVSIGLLCDFLMHVLLKYYECSPQKSRDDRVKETLETMGASILLGGLTTFLGVIPLVFSTTKIFFTVFLAFFGMVVLGITHGLVLMPVVLSLIGPKSGLEVHEDGVTTFETEIGGPVLHDDLVAELRAIEEEAEKRESAAAAAGVVGVEAPVVDEETPKNVEPDGDEPDEPEEEAPPKRKTLTDVMV
jgi:Patched family